MTMETDLHYRAFVIANPVAGAGAVERDWDWIERLLNARLPEWDAAFTEGPGHATMLTREALRAGWDMIVCVGGDGTINEVVNGFFETPDAPETYRLDDGWVRPADDTGQPPEPTPIDDDAVLGLIPLGTGGDFRRSVGLMGGFSETIGHLTGRSTVDLDLGEIGFLDDDGTLESRYFINIASAGFSGLVDRIANERWKGMGGAVSFFMATSLAFFRWRNVDIEVVIDETHQLEGPTQNLVVANGEYFGGGMWVAPGADVDDGEFQVVRMGDMSHGEMLSILPKIYRGRHLDSDKIDRYRANHVAARTTDPEDSVDLDVDGETPGRLPAYWSIHHNALQLKF